MSCPDDHNPWGSWTSQHEPAVAHPDAPQGGSGYGFSREAGESGAGWGNFEAIEPISPDGVHLMPEEAAAEYATDGFSRLSAKLRAALSWNSASAVARRILGRKTFGLRAGEALAAEMKQAGAEILSPQRALLFADIHDLLTRRIRSRCRDVDDLESRTDMGRQMMRREPGLSAGRLKQAVEVRKNLVQEVAAFQRSVAPKPSAQPEWVSLVMTPAGRQPEAMDKAGEAFGKALAHCLSTLADARPSAADAKAGAVAYPNLAKAVQQMRAVATAGAPLAVDSARSKPSSKSSAAPVPVNDAAQAANSDTVLQPTPSDIEQARSSGHAPEQRAAREKVARSFYQEHPSLGELRCEDDIRGIDLNEPVEVVDFPPPPTMGQYVRKGAQKPGNFFDPIGDQSADSMGLNGDNIVREHRTYKTPEGSGLKSTAAPITDDWTDRNNPVQTAGGGQQIVVDLPTSEKFIQI